MTHVKSLLAGTAIATLFALPAAALSIGAESDFRLSLDTSVPDVSSAAAAEMATEEIDGAKRDGGVTAEGSQPDQGLVVENAPPQGAERSDTLGGDGTSGMQIAGTAAVVDPNFAGDAVITSDSQVVGVVDQVVADEQGNQKLIIALDAGVIAEGVQHVAFTIDSGARSDGQIVLSLSKSEFEDQINDASNSNTEGKS